MRARKDTSHGHAEVLWVLHGTGPRTQRELSQILKCTPRNVTGLVDALQAAGFVERTAHPTDRRAIMVRLSEQGQSLIAGWGADREHGTAQVLGDIPANELAVFSAVLDRVLAQLRATHNPSWNNRPRQRNPDRGLVSELPPVVQEVESTPDQGSSNPWS